MVGAGSAAARKSGLLIKAGAHVTVVAPHVSEEMQPLLNSPNTAHEERSYIRDDLHARVMVIAATNNPELNLEIASDAKNLGILCNVADQPAAGSFTLPSIIDRNPLYIAISSHGTSPILSRILKNRLDVFIPKSYGALATLIRQYSSEVSTRFKQVAARKRFWEDTLNSNVAELVLTGQESDARHALEDRIANSTNVNQTGEVYLVGAGPGNPDLLTFRALRLIQHADVVLYDRLVAPAIMALCHPQAERVYVGKRRADHAMPQTSINQTLIDYANAGKRVLRLKGGDPFIFGRGGEEIESLAEHNIPFQVVPGITAASGCASYAGIPLTHRDHAQSCTFVTGHLKDGTIDLDWNRLVGSEQTIVCYMGLMGLPVICEQLICHGLPANTPAALVERGTTNEQQVYTGTVTSLPQIIASQEVSAPTLIIIGSVVTLREKLAWSG